MSLERQFATQGCGLARQIFIKAEREIPKAPLYIFPGEVLVFTDQGSSRKIEYHDSIWNEIRQSYRNCFDLLLIGRPYFLIVDHIEDDKSFVLNRQTFPQFRVIKFQNRYYNILWGEDRTNVDYLYQLITHIPSRVM